jgi:hypothetical protein
VSAAHPLRRRQALRPRRAHVAGRRAQPGSASAAALRAPHCAALRRRVQNLFHSVQLNVNNPHFLIMQGRITKVLNMKPPEILGLLEEAAGTKMYESKKQAALRTLEKKQVKVEEINKASESAGDGGGPEPDTPSSERGAPAAAGRGRRGACAGDNAAVAATPAVGPDGRHRPGTGQAPRGEERLHGVGGGHLEPRPPEALLRGAPVLGGGQASAAAGPRAARGRAARPGGGGGGPADAQLGACPAGCRLQHTAEADVEAGGLRLAELEAADLALKAELREKEDEISGLQARAAHAAELPPAKPARHQAACAMQPAPLPPLGAELRRASAVLVSGREGSAERRRGQGADAASGRAVQTASGGAVFLGRLPRAETKRPGCLCAALRAGWGTRGVCRRRPRSCIGARRAEACPAVLPAGWSRTPAHGPTRRRSWTPNLPRPSSWPKHCSRWTRPDWPPVPSWPPRSATWRAQRWTGAPPNFLCGMAETARSCRRSAPARPCVLLAQVARPAAGLRAALSLLSRLRSASWLAPRRATAGTPPTAACRSA